MQKLMGSAVYGGIGRGVLKFFHREEVVISKARVVDTLRELRRFAYARNEVVEELKNLYTQALEEVGDEEAQIFLIHQMILDDNQYVTSMERLILNEHCNAEFAVVRTVKLFSKMMGDMSSESEYISERIADIRDVSARLLRRCTSILPPTPSALGCSQSPQTIVWTLFAKNVCKQFILTTLEPATKCMNTLYPRRLTIPRKLLSTNRECKCCARS